MPSRTPRRARAALLALACGASAAAVALVPGSALAGETTATIGASFSPNRLGAKAAMTFTLRFAGGEFGVPAPVRRAVVHFPAGLTLNIPSVRDCSRARLVRSGANGCPARAEIGAGRAIADVHVGSEVEEEEAQVWEYLGPPRNGDPTIEVIGQGYTPLDERVVFAGTVIPDKAPYGEQLVMPIPAIPTIPLEPDASTLFLSLTVGGKHSRTHGKNTVVLPTRCPAGGFPFAAEFTYADGSTSTASTTAPCP